MNIDPMRPYADQPEGESGGRELTRRKPRNETARKKGMSIVWMLVISVALLLISMFAPLIFILSMKVGFQASIRSTEHFAEGPGTVLTGAESEQYTRTIATEYSAQFVPSRLEEHAMTFNMIAILYGPMMLTGAPLELTGVPEAENSQLSSTAFLRFSSWLPMIIFLIAFILLLLILDFALGNPGSLLKFIVTLSVIWLIYSLVMWAAGEWTMSSVSQMLNRLLTEEQGTAKYVLGFGNVIAAPIRLFLWGIIYWVLSSLIRRSKSEQPRNDFASAKQLRADQAGRDSA
jgi:hypothetical protein